MSTSVFPSPSAEALANAVAEAGSMKKLSDQIGINVATISRLTSGNLRRPSERDTEILQQKLGISRDGWKWFRNAEDEALELENADLDLSPAAYLKIVRSWRKKLQEKASAPRDITAALDCERRAVELVRKSQEEDAPEIIELIRSALAPWPDAREAVARALRDAGYG